MLSCNLPNAERAPDGTMRVVGLPVRPGKFETHPDSECNKPSPRRCSVICRNCNAGAVWLMFLSERARPTHCHVCRITNGRFLHRAVEVERLEAIR